MDQGREKPCVMVRKYSLLFCPLWSYPIAFGKGHGKEMMRLALRYVFEITDIELVPECF